MNDADSDARVDASSPWRLSVAPMMAWTNRHCRYLHRMLTRHTRLYTEMITTGALLHGDVPLHLAHDALERPVALQLGGNDPRQLAQCAQLGEQWGYDEINLNCCCPSERVQRGAFGACLMDEPDRVAECIDAMRAATDLPVTVKHRTGIDRQESYGFMRDFVGTVAAAGCEVFMVHARNAWLQGLSPKENRNIPPLHHDWAWRLKRDFPHLTIVINGGIAEGDEIARHLREVDGVMIGRAAYHRPWALAGWDERFFGAPASSLTRDEVETAMVDYMERQQAAGIDWPSIARHMLGLRHGQRGARGWRRVWSDHSLAARPVREVAALARAHLGEPVAA